MDAREGQACGAPCCNTWWALLTEGQAVREKLPWPWMVASSVGPCLTES
jgi:hypothetical protein